MRRLCRIALALTAASCNVVADESPEGETERQTRAAGGSMIEPVTEKACNYHDFNCRTLNSTGKNEGRRLADAEKSAAILDSYGGQSVSGGVGLLWWEYLAEGVGWMKLEIRDSGNIVVARRYWYDWGQQRWIEYAAQSADSVNGSWTRSDYAGPAAALGVANNQSFRNRVDGAVLAVMNSDVGISVMKAGSNAMIGAGILKYSDGNAQACHDHCSDKAGRRGIWIGLGAAATCAGVGFVLGNVPGALLAGFSCSVAGTLVGYFGADSSACFGSCLSCLKDAEKSCQATGHANIPRDSECSGVFYCGDSNGDNKGDTITTLLH